MSFGPSGLKANRGQLHLVDRRPVTLFIELNGFWIKTGKPEVRATWPVTHGGLCVPGFCAAGRREHSGRERRPDPRRREW